MRGCGGCAASACLVVLLLALAIAGAVVYLRRFPTPLSCALDHVRPVKFKIDVTDFWAPRISATLQAVLNVGNRNLLDLLLLEACKVTVYEARTGLKLGSASSNALTISPFSSTTVSVNVLGIGANAPQPGKSGSRRPSSRRSGCCSRSSPPPPRGCRSRGARRRA